MKKLTIVGAGFSGLTLAALLEETELFQITVFEKKSVGGVLQSEVRHNTVLEQAALSLLNHHELEGFLKRQNVEIELPLKAAKNKYLYYDFLRRWPLGFFESLHFSAKALLFLLSPAKAETLKGHSVKSWAEKYLTPAFAEKVLQTALLGIYASPAEKLSAELVLGRFFKGHTNRASRKGSVIPKGGLSVFLQNLKKDLIEKNVAFAAAELTADEIIALRKEGPVIFAVSFADLRLLAKNQPEYFFHFQNSSHKEKWQSLLQKIETISLSKLHLFFESTARHLNGFGVLFHPKHRFHALGFTANSDVFLSYGPAYNEAWILNDAVSPAEDLLSQVTEDRRRSLNSDDRVTDFTLSRHHDVYPVYSNELKQWLQQTSFQPGFYGTGNYWGSLGLTQIFLQNLQLKESLKKEYE